MEKSVIIVGAGIAGLTAGFYARLNGFKTTIFESHNIPGGLCTAWKVNGYKFDISMHMVTGSKSGPLHQLWEELGVAKEFTFHYHKNAMLVVGMGKKLVISSNKEQLVNDMLAISPTDEKPIREFTDLIFGPDMMGAASLKSAELENVFDKVKKWPAILPLIPKFIKYKSSTIQEFAKRFKDPFLSDAVRFFIDSPGWPMPQFPLAVMCGFMKSGITEAGTPLGGSQKVALHIAKQFENLGGQFRFNSRVKNLVVENEKVTGIVLEDGSVEKADLVIWAGDGHALIFDMLGGKYINDRIRKIYNNWIPVKPVVSVAIGVNRDLSAEPHSLVFQPEETITIAGYEFKWLSALHHCFDKSMAPEGKSAIEVWYATDYDYWNDLLNDRTKYDAEKKRIADYTVSQLDKRWPGFASQTEVIDVSTPATYFRYTGNWKGSPDGWYITSDNWSDMRFLRELPGLGGLLTIGQWTAPFTGTIMAATSGRQIIEIICKREGKKFVAPKI
jgi:phytoene dehydrogenase-like protein